MLGASVISNTFTGVHKPTLGVDFHFRRFEEAGESIALQLWDIAGRCMVLSAAVGVRISPFECCRR